MLNDTLVIDTLTIVNNINNKIYINDSLINNLNNRITNLENTDTVDMNTILTVVVTVGLFILNFFIMKKSYREDKERSILVNISDEFNNVEKSFTQSNSDNNDKETIAMELEKVLNVIEVMCYNYIRNKINKEDFDFKYKNIILAYYDSFPEYYGSGITSYNMTIKYVKKQKPNR